MVHHHRLMICEPPESQAVHQAVAYRIELLVCSPLRNARRAAASFIKGWDRQVRSHLSHNGCVGIGEVRRESIDPQAAQCLEVNEVSWGSIHWRGGSIQIGRQKASIPADCI